MLPEDELLQLIRHKISAGELPRKPCRMTWYGPGKGTACDACNSPITNDEVEVECDVVDGGTVRFHRRCHEAWAEARPACDAWT